MTKFINMYEDNDKVDALYKSLISLTAVTPIVMILALFATAISQVVGVLFVVLLCSVVITGLIVAGKISGRFNSIPLFIASCAMPIYSIVLYALDPSFMGVSGILLVIAVPVVVFSVLGYAALKSWNNKELINEEI